MSRGAEPDAREARTGSGRSRPVLDVRMRLSRDRFELDLELRATAHVTGIFGPSGSGKTSLLEAVAGLEGGARGEIRFGTEVWLDSAAGRITRPEARDVGYVPQDGRLFPHKDVRGNLLAGAARARRRGENPESSLRTVCELLELGPILDRDVGTLSGGERQRVALGRAICSGPRLLLLDEPLASLDLPLRHRLLPFLRRVRRELDLPMLVVSHDPTEILALCDEVVVLSLGRIVGSGRPQRVLTDPEIFPLARREGFENVVPGTLASSEGGTSDIAIGEEGPVITVPRVSGAPGREVLLGIPAREILLATREPAGLSARNVLRARIAEVRTVGDFSLATATVAGGAAEVAVEVTERSSRELGLEEGLEVFLVLKVRSCVVYGAEPPTAEAPAG